jgi:hypothetical protein
MSWAWCELSKASFRFDSQSARTTCVAIGWSQSRLKLFLPMLHILLVLLKIFSGARAFIQTCKVSFLASHSKINIVNIFKPSSRVLLKKRQIFYRSLNFLACLRADKKPKQSSSCVIKRRVIYL